MLGENHPMTDCNFKLFLRRIYNKFLCLQSCQIWSALFCFTQNFLGSLLWVEFLNFTFMANPSHRHLGRAALLLFRHNLIDFFFQGFKSLLARQGHISVGLQRKLYAVTKLFKLLIAEQLILVDKPRTSCEIFLCRRIIIVVIPLTNSSIIIGAIPYHELKTVLGIFYCK